MPAARRGAWRPSARVGTLVCTARAGGVRVQIGPHHRPVQQQTLGQGHGLPSSRDRLLSISASLPLRSHPSPFLSKPPSPHSAAFLAPPGFPGIWAPLPASAGGAGDGERNVCTPEEPPPPRPPDCAPGGTDSEQGPRPPLQVGLQLCPQPGLAGRRRWVPAAVGEGRPWRPAWRDRAQPLASPAQVQAPEAKLRGEGGRALAGFRQGEILFSSRMGMPPERAGPTPHRAAASSSSQHGRPPCSPALPRPMRLDGTCSTEAQRLRGPGGSVRRALLDGSPSLTASRVALGHVSPLNTKALSVLP